MANWDNAAKPWCIWEVCISGFGSGLRDELKLLEGQMLGLYCSFWHCGRLWTHWGFGWMYGRTSFFVIGPHYDDIWSKSLWHAERLADPSRNITSIISWPNPKTYSQFAIPVTLPIGTDHMGPNQIHKPPQLSFADSLMRQLNWAAFINTLLFSWIISHCSWPQGTVEGSLDH